MIPHEVVRDTKIGLAAIDFAHRVKLANAGIGDGQVALHFSQMARSAWAEKAMETSL